jgi:hypothetical protein
MGLIIDALKCYDRALEINPNYQSAIRNRERCMKIIELQRKEAAMSSEESGSKDNKSNKKSKSKKKKLKHAKKTKNSK